MSEISSSSSAQSITIALAGNPNVGKSTLFNLLTGSKQKIGNFAGVTVEKKTGTLNMPGCEHITLIDLPGAYSLDAKSEDEHIAAKAILGEMPDLKRPDLVLVLVEAANLSRGLFLFWQVQSRHPQAVLVINMIDELHAEGRKIDIQKLKNNLSAPIAVVSAKTGEGIDDLHKIIQSAIPFTDNLKPRVQNSHIENIYPKIDRLVSEVLTTNKSLKNKTESIDQYLLHPIFGPVLFLLVMLAMFQAIFTWSAPLTDGIDAGLALLGEKAGILTNISWLNSLLAEGVIAGVGSVLVFVPQIAITFLFIGILETTGYLSRGAFMTDRLMRAVGLEGRAFIPLLSPFGCAVPGILATRTIPDAKQRLITILIAPLMTCSARLPVYTLLIATFVPETYFLGFLSLQGIVLFSLFIVGLVFGFFISFIMSKLGERKTKTGFFIELPRYRLPTFRHLWYFISFRVGAFLKSAGTTIFFLSLILWALAYFPHNERTVIGYDKQIVFVENADDHDEDERAAIIAEIENARSAALLENSYMGQLGNLIEPVIAPLGYDWKLGVGILASFAAREVFVATLGIVFGLGGDTDENSTTLRDQLKNSTHADGTPLYGLPTAFSLMVFFALAAQCISTLAVIKRETNSTKWAWVTFGYMSALAYISAFLTYQGMSFAGF